MNQLQMKYNLAHILYWIVYCAECGFTAIFLQSKGMTNTEIGLVTGSGCVITIFLSPFVTSIINKHPKITVKKMFTMIIAFLSLVFLSVAFIQMPVILVMACYICILSTFVSTVPFLSMIAMDYLHEGREINFGLARGMGSVFYAVAAVVLGEWINLFSANVLAIVFMVGGILFLLVLYRLPDSQLDPSTKTNAKNGSFFSFIRKYQILFFILLGFAFAFAASSSISTYLINIIENLGGDTSIYGVTIFLMAASEMPAMAVVPRLIRRYHPMNLVMFAGGCYIIRNFLICLAPSLPFVFIGMLFQSVTYGILTSLLTYYVSDVTDKKDEAMGQTFIGVMTSGFGATIGNFFGGFIQDALGLPAMLGMACVLTAIGSGIMVVTALYAKKKLPPRRILS